MLGVGEEPMAYRTILVPFRGGERDVGALNVALALGGKFGGHVEAFHAEIDPRAAVAFVGEGMTAAMIEQIMAAAEHEAEDRRSLARRRFDEVCAAAGIAKRATPGESSGASVNWIARRGVADDLIVERGRLADLIVVAAGGDDETEFTETVQVCLRETGRPVLIVPAQVKGANFGRTIAVGWNGSVESARALAAALPFLAEAARVVVLSVEEGQRIGPTGAAVVEYLGWHGVNASARILADGSFGAGKALLQGVVDAGADLLVMGAYSRSRMRRLIFGGVTGEVLAHTAIPVLMLH
jgi:nucleotide-binding universal stress UspA family protein